jgi:hypothetical protein
VQFGGVYPVSHLLVPPPVLDDATDQDLLAVRAFPRLRRVNIERGPPQKKLSESAARDLVASYGVPSVSFASAHKVTLYERKDGLVLAKTTSSP